ncbi:MAG: hypothetical protein KatS3mg032_2365 [Cyclobacteriaceae bacterium]|nr:MAG: hypothetical protein KatS3mg032_2365 [Cyclobacteriaceae bacterium]
MFFLRFFCAGVFLIFSQGSFAQVTISGCLTDKKDSTDFSQVAVILYHINSDNVLTYTFTDSSGCFVFNQVPEGIFTIKVNYPGYQPFSRDIVVATNDSVRITVPIILEQKTNMLSEIIVKGTRPVIVKKDTVIYDPSYWTQTTDRTLEEVLVRMPGFKISSEGEIFVNNKPVEKVLIDGKEISNAGAAIITRSVDPEDVKKIEVRFDEKDAVLKESLLETRKLVVLDIELKEDIKKSFFGLARASAGYQQAAGAGFYGNFFSLKKKINLHAFAEHDRFGHQTISLDAIKNLGEEAFKKNLQINADFNEEIEKTEFKKEIYGFKDFNLYRNTIAGITFNKQLNTKLKLYGGSYNNHQILGNQERYEQQFIDQNNINFIKTNKYDYFSSKSKAELRFDSQQIKGRFDVNVAITNNRLISTNIGNANYHYNTNTSHTSINLYQNAMLEYLAKNGWALRFKSALAYLNSNERKNMAHNDSTYGWVLYNSSGNTVYNFAQNIFNQQLTWGSSAGVFLNKSKWKSAFQFYTLTQQIRHSKTGWDEALLNHEAPLANFTLPETTRQFFKFSPALSQTLTFNNLKFSGEFFLYHYSVSTCLFRRPKC